LPDYGAKRGCGISVVDPGAVPGGSTKTALGIYLMQAALWGRNSFDTRDKGD